MNTESFYVIIIGSVICGIPLVISWWNEKIVNRLKLRVEKMLDVQNFEAFKTALDKKMPLEQRALYRLDDEKLAEAVKKMIK